MKLLRLGLQLGVEFSQGKLDKQVSVTVLGQNYVLVDVDVARAEHFLLSA